MGVPLIFKQKKDARPRLGGRTSINQALKNLASQFMPASGAIGVFFRQNGAALGANHAGRGNCRRGGLSLLSSSGRCVLRREGFLFCGGNCGFRTLIRGMVRRRSNRRFLSGRGGNCFRRSNGRCLLRGRLERRLRGGRGRSLLRGSRRYRRSLGNRRLLGHGIRISLLLRLLGHPIGLLVRHLLEIRLTALLQGGGMDRFCRLIL